jgi:hypothetical protein
VVTMLDYRICKEGQSPRQVASDWLHSTGAMPAAG